MVWRSVTVVLLALLASICQLSLAAVSPHRRFEYKYSFKSPYLAQKDNQVPFWSYSGNAIASSESLRITPSLRSQKGQAWCKQPTNFDWWEVEIVFRINGRGRVGADGLAFWYTTAPSKEGPVFGSADMWNGLGIFFDSFDNDNKRNNPYVMAMVNDGTKAYDHENDGMSQLLGGCLRDFRNKPHPVRAKIEYYQNSLTVKIQNINLDALGFNETSSDDLYSLYHLDPSSMGRPLHGNGSFLSNFPSHHNQNASSDSNGSQSSGMFGSWFASAQELEPEAHATPTYDDVLDAADAQDGYEQTPPSDAPPDATDITPGENGSLAAGIDALHTAVNGSAPLGEGGSESDRNSGWFGEDKSSAGETAVLNGNVEGESRAAKMRRAKILRKKRKLESKRRRKIATKYRKLGEKKTRVDPREACAWSS